MRHYRPHSLLSLSEASDVLGLPVRAVRHLAETGRLVTYRVPGEIRPVRRVRYAEVVALQRQIEASATTGGGGNR